MKHVLAAAMPLLLTGVVAAQTAPVNLPATPSTVVWGYYSAKAKPVLTVHSGDTVRIQTLSTCGPTERLEEEGVARRRHSLLQRRHLSRGEGQGPGRPYSYRSGRYRRGRARRRARSADPQDRNRHSVRLQWLCRGPRLSAQRLSLRRLQNHSPRSPQDDGQFRSGHRDSAASLLRQHGRRSAPLCGRIDSAPPWMHAGNMDNKELVAGTTLYIPVHAKGALFEVGDGHAGQGNGEVDITAMETFLTGTFSFIVHKDQHLLWPRAETPTHYISMGFSPDLKEATTLAVRDMINFLVEQKHLSRDDAYMLTSVAVDVDITQLVDGNVGVHAMCPKSIFTK